MAGVKTLQKPEDWLQEGTDKYMLLTGWLRDGLSNMQIYENMGIHKATFYRWVNSNEEFATLIKTFREVEIRHVENALFEQCKKGNTAAIIFYLKNKKPDIWKDKLEQTADVNIKEYDAADNFIVKQKVQIEGTEDV